MPDARRYDFTSIQYCRYKKHAVLFNKDHSTKYLCLYNSRSGAYFVKIFDEPEAIEVVQNKINQCSKKNDILINDVNIKITPDAKKSLAMIEKTLNERMKKF